MKKLYLIEILHQTTTMPRAEQRGHGLYLIEILHQTTTLGEELLLTPQLYLIEILHQTTTDDEIDQIWAGCILSKFYIKPQLETLSFLTLTVVSYRNSTSNHNVGPHID